MVVENKIGLTEKEVIEIKEHLENSQRPLFFYDNDADGLCSFVLFRRYLDRGKGVAIRSFPNLNESYARKVDELNADYVFILDKPSVDTDFLKKVSEKGIPIVWIDHHNIEGNNPDLMKEDYENLFIYNWAEREDENGLRGAEQPVTYWAYKITGRKEDSWIGVAGCISDHYLPDFVSEFEKDYEEYWKNGISDPFEALFETGIGEIAKGINFGLKDSTTNIVKFQNFLISVKNPSEVFEESGKNYDFRRKYKEIKDRYDSLILKAKECIDGDLLFFEYGGTLSISSEISNELNHRYGDKTVVVAYKNQGIVNLSLRGDNVKEALEDVFFEEEFQGGSGGGHRDAVGARIRSDDLVRFRNVLKIVLEKRKNKGDEDGKKCIGERDEDGKN